MQVWAGGLREQGQGGAHPAQGPQLEAPEAPGAEGTLGAGGGRPARAWRGRRGPSPTGGWQRGTGHPALPRSPPRRKMEVGFCLTRSDRAVLWDKGLTLGEQAEKAQRWPSDNPIVWGLSPAVGAESAKFMTFQREMIQGRGEGGREGCAGEAES